MSLCRAGWTQPIWAWDDHLGSDETLHQHLHQWWLCILATQKLIFMAWLHGSVQVSLEHIHHTSQLIYVLNTNSNANSNLDETMYGSWTMNYFTLIHHPEDELEELEKPICFFHSREQYVSIRDGIVTMYGYPRLIKPSRGLLDLPQWITYSWTVIN